MVSMGFSRTGLLLSKHTYFKVVQELSACVQKARFFKFIKIAQNLYVSTELDELTGFFFKKSLDLNY